MAILNDTIIRGNLYLKKDDINIILGNSKIKAVTVSSDRLIYGDSNYFTDINAKHLSIKSSASINGDLTVTGDTEMESVVIKSLGVNDDIITRLLTVTENSILSTTTIGTASSNKNLTVNGSISTSNNLSVTGTSSLGTTTIGTASSNKNLTVNGSLTVTNKTTTELLESGDTTISNLTVTGTTTLNDIEIKSLTVINKTTTGSLESGNTTLGTTTIGSSSSNKNLTVNGNNIIYGNVTIGTASINREFKVYGNGTFTTTLTAHQLKRDGVSSNWIGGRDGALVRLNTINGYSVINSVKTSSGSWEIGSYSSDADKLLFTYISDSKYNAKNNNYETQIKFLNNGNIEANLNGNASSADKLNTDAGSTTNPIYFKNGIPVACKYTLGKSVPSDAVFTDTTYKNATQSSSGLMSASDKKKLDDTSTTTATQSSPGLMSASDKKKLDSITNTISGIEFGIMEVSAADNWGKTNYTFKLNNKYTNYFVITEIDELIEILIVAKNSTSFTIQTQGKFQGGSGGARKIGYCVIGN